MVAIWLRWHPSLAAVSGERSTRLALGGIIAPRRLGRKAPPPDGTLICRESSWLVQWTVGQRSRAHRSAPPILPVSSSCAFILLPPPSAVSRRVWRLGDLRHCVPPQVTRELPDPSSLAYASPGVDSTQQLQGGGATQEGTHDTPHLQNARSLTTSIEHSSCAGWRGGSEMYVEFTSLKCTTFVSQIGIHVARRATFVIT